MADLDLDAIAALRESRMFGVRAVLITPGQRDALVDEVRRLRAIEDAARLADANLRDLAAVGLDECMEAWDVLRDALEADRG